ncbi:NYN domain-containing protein [Arenicella chitinivorans]|uniref:NYN domain-containing protein n=1 Tax=Arenicella chitinivorans TaxID=1329800 RepID=UPI00357123AF
MRCCNSHSIEDLPEVAITGHYGPSALIRRARNASTLRFSTLRNYRSNRSSTGIVGHNKEESQQKIALFINADKAPACRFDDILSEVVRYRVVTVRKAYGNWKKTNLKPWENLVYFSYGVYINHICRRYPAQSVFTQAVVDDCRVDSTQ